MKKIIVILSILVIAKLNVIAQQDAMFTHYMYNTLWLNPAYAGTREALTSTLIHRSQWLGFDGSPVGQSLTLHSPFLDGKIGVGLSILNDKIGPTKNTSVAVDFAYHLKLDTKSKIAFGIKGLANFYKNNINTLNTDQQGDVAFSQNNNSVLPNAGMGVYYYRKSFYAGISTPKLLENTLNNSSTKMSKEQRHYFFIVGAVFDITKTIKIKPTAFIKATAAAPIQADLTGTFLFNDKFNAGLMYRSGDALGILTGYNFTNQFYLGYSFDWSIANTTGKYNSGSHEIMLRYDLIYKSKAKITSIRYF